MQYLVISIARSLTSENKLQDDAISMFRKKKLAKLWISIHITIYKHILFVLEQCFKQRLPNQNRNVTKNKNKLYITE